MAKKKARLGNNPLAWIKDTTDITEITGVKEKELVEDKKNTTNAEETEIKERSRVAEVTGAEKPPQETGRNDIQVTEANMNSRIDILNRIKNNQITLEEGLKLIKQINSKPGEVRNHTIHTNEEPATMYFQPYWEKSDLHREGFKIKPGEHIVIFDIEEDIYHALQMRLPENSGNIVLVKPGKRYLETKNQVYEIDPGNPEHYRRLAGEFRQRQHIPGNILYMWAKANEPFSPDTGDDALTDQLARGIYSIFYLTQALIEEKTKEKTGGQVHLLYVYPALTNGAELYQAASAAVSGFARTLHLENPGFIYKTINIPGHDWGKSIPDLELLLQELQAAPGDAADVRIDHNNERFVMRLEELKSYHQSDPSMSLSIKQKGVYLVTGGASGVGFLFARYLARIVNAKLILVGRSQLDDVKKNRLQQLQSLGAEAVYIRADISLLQDVNRLLQEIRSRFGALDGIIHSAGIIQDALIHKKTKESIDTVLGPKLYGTSYLDEVTKNEKLDFFVMFSSIASVLGNEGQSDYAYANRFMDHFAAIREGLRQKGERWGRTISIDWPYWQEGSMRIPEDIFILIKQQAGLEKMPTREGINAFEKIFKYSSPQCLVVYGIPHKIRERLIKKDTLPDSAPNLAPHTPHTSTQVDMDRLYEETQRFLRKKFSDLIKLPLNKIDNRVRFEEYGIDSILVRKFNLVMEKELGKLSKTLLFEFHNLSELVDYFVKSHQSQLVDLFGIQVRSHSPETVKPKEVSPAVSAQDTPAPQPLSKKSPLTQDIAVIGLSGRYPLADNLEDYYENIKAGKDCITEIPADRWDYRRYYDPDPVNSSLGKIYCKWGGFISDVDKFDPMFFNISPRDAEIMDPQERLFLETVWAVLEDAGYTKKQLRKYIEDRQCADIGVFVGVTANSYMLFGPEEWSKGNLIIPTSFHWSIANRVSYIFNFQGPSIPVDTACSSSLTAIYLACESINRGECSMAVAGGVNLYLHPSKYIHMCAMQMLSRTGKCHTFGDGGDGFIPGEGVGAVFLKPLDAAIKDGDHIYALIKGGAINHGGYTNGYTVPNPKAQANLIIKALKHTQIDPRTISYIEAHGTGTSLGDPIEIEGLTKAFREYTQQKQYCSIGSVKSNIGHLESAAGISGLTKIILQMKHKQLVPSLHAETLNPNIRFEDSPFYVQHTASEWKQPIIKDNGIEKPVPRRAGLSSFGVGGANVHLIVEEWAGTSPVQADETGPHISQPQFIPLSARHEHQLTEYAGKLLAFLEKTSRYHNSSFHRSDSSNIFENIQSHMLNLVAGFLDTHPQHIDVDVEMFELGMDPVHFSLFSQQISEKFKIEISPAVFSQYSSIKAFSQYLFEHFREKFARSSDNSTRSYSGIGGLTVSHSAVDSAPGLADIAYTMQMGREPLEERIVAVVFTTGELIDCLKRFCQGQADIENLYRGNARKKKENADSFLEGREGEAFIKIIINDKKWSKLARLWVSGVDIDWGLLHGKPEPRRISLPTYPFARERYWVPVAGTQEITEKVKKLHPLIHLNSSTLKEQKYTTRLTGEEFFLADHVIDGVKVLPGVVYLEMARAAGHLAGEKPVKKIKNVTWATPIRMGNHPQDVHISLYPQPDAGHVRYEVTTNMDQDEQPIVHARGILVYEHNNPATIPPEPGYTQEPAANAVKDADIIDINSVKQRCQQYISGAEYYRISGKTSFKYGPSLQSIDELYMSPTEALSFLDLPAESKTGSPEYILHPSWMDGALQTVMGTLGSTGTEPISPYIPYIMGELEILTSPDDSCYVYAVLVGEHTAGNSRERKYDIRILDRQGNVNVRMKDFSFISMSRQTRSQPDSTPPELSDREIAAPLICHLEWEKRLISQEIPLSPDRNRESGHILVFDVNEVRWNLLKAQEPDIPEIILVKPGTQYQASNRGVFQINPANPADYFQLMEALKNRDFIPSKILHLWSQGSFTEDSEVLEDQMNRSVYSLLYLTQALMARALPPAAAPLRLLYVYHTPQQSDYNHRYNPLYAAASGFVHSLRRENSRFIYKVIEIIDSETCGPVPGYTWENQELLEQVWQEFQCEDEVEVRLLGQEGQRYVKCLKELDRGEIPGKPLKLRKNGVYVITGGVGALGLLFADYFTRQENIRLVLTDMPPYNDEIGNKLRALPAAGSEVVYIPADISQRQQVETLAANIKSRFGAINGILHCAGANRDSFISNKTREDFQTVLAPKISGTIHLAEVCKHEIPDFFVLFSSVAAVLGNPGQSDYAYANCFMDHFASASQGNTRMLSINWPLWQAGGMKIDSQKERMMATSAGMTPLPTAAGLEIFSRVLASSQKQLVVFQGTPQKIKKTLGMDLAAEKHTPTTIRPSGTNQEELVGKLQQDLVKMVSPILKINEKNIDIDGEMRDYGFDSVTQTQLINKVNEIYQLEFSPAVFFELEAQTLGALAEYLYKNRPDTFARYYQGSITTDFGDSHREHSPGREVNFIPEPFSRTADNSIGEAEGNRFTVRDITIRTRDFHYPRGVEFRENQVVTGSDAVAIIGMSGVMPQAKDLETFWKHLAEGKDLISEVPRQRWQRNVRFQDPRGTQWGGFMADIDQFDPKFFNISPREAEMMDPQQRLILQTAWKTIEDAGYQAADFSGTGLGVFIGVSGSDYYELWKANSRGFEDSDLYSHYAPYVPTGMSHSILANRISYLLNLSGPSECIDTACSSSLVAIHRAVQAIQNGSCQMAIAGGVNVLLSPTVSHALGAAGMLSPDGRCKTFDKKADGYVRGEGVGAILLKPLSRAAADNDHIYAVIRGSAENHGGHANSLTAPNANSQAELLIEAYEKAGFDPTTITHIEAHGTGTNLGDPVEINALKKAFAQLYQRRGQAIPAEPHCGIGSVKTNIGHLEAAAGIAGLIKVLLAMKHKTLPAVVHFNQLNPYIELQGSPFYIVSETQPWKALENETGETIPRRAGVSSFGFGGTNAHLVIEEYLPGTIPIPLPPLPPPTPTTPGTVSQETFSQLIFLSAKNEEQLNIYARDMADYLDQFSDKAQESPLPGPTLAEIAYTLQNGRESLDQRLALLVTGLDDLSRKLRQYGQDNNDTDMENVFRGNARENKTGLELLLEGEIKDDLIRMAVQTRNLKKLARLWVCGVDIDWKQLYSENHPQRVSLPTYPFEKKRYWFALPGKSHPDIDPTFNPGAGVENQQGAGATRELELTSSPAKPAPEIHKLVLRKPGKADIPGIPLPPDQPGKNKETIPGQHSVNDIIEEKIRGRLSSILHIEQAEIKGNIPVQEFGLDSIGGIELINGLKQDFQVDLKAVALYDHPTVDKLVEYLAPLVKPELINAVMDKVPEKTVAKQAFPPKIVLKKDTDTLAKIHITGEDFALGEESNRPVINSDVAVIGMSGRFPDAAHIWEFWDNISSGVDSIKEVPGNRWDVSRYYDPDPQKPNKIYCKWGGFVDDVDKFDPLFFRISPSDAEVIDPQQRLFLQECVRALEDAGYSEASLKGKKCGIHVGVVNFNDYNYLLQGSHDDDNVNLGQLMLGNANAILAARACYFLDLKGPALAIDTACSSSLVAIHQACRSLQNRETDMMLAGGVLLSLSHQRFLHTCKTGALSRSGKCSTFDNSADGYVPGEGVGVIVLKLLDKAIADNDHIYGVIKGTGLNQDGTTNGITAPSAESQRDLELDVYRTYGINPETITYVEAHGTGTKLGDPIEVTALTNAFSQYTDKKQYCAIGSVKTNIGHAAAAAGIASIIKVLMALNHKQIPPSLNFRQANEHIRFEETPFFVNTELRQWNVGGEFPRRAAVSAFGLSGTNCHIILEEPPTLEKRKQPSTPPWFLIPLSAKTREALQRRMQDLGEWLETRGKHQDIGDISYLLFMGRTHYQVRCVLLASNTVQMRQKIKENDYLSNSQQKSIPTDPSLIQRGNRLIDELLPGKIPSEREYKEKLLELADLYVHGYDLEWGKLFHSGNYRRISLPTYPFARESCWLPRINASHPMTGTPAPAARLHPFIETNCSTFRQMEFRTRLTGNEFYLCDHVIDNKKIFPATAYMEMARAAGEMAARKKVWKLKNIIFAQPIALADQPQEVTIRLYPGEEKTEFKICTEDDNSRNIEHAQGMVIYEIPGTSETPEVHGSRERMDIEQVKARCSHSIKPGQLYELFQQVGVTYGPTFRTITELYYNGSESLARLQLPGELTAGFHEFALHPSFMDGLLQSTIGIALEDESRVKDTNYLPFVLGELEIINPGTPVCWAYASKSGTDHKSSAQVMKFNIRLLDEQGNLLVRLQDFSVLAVQPSPQHPPRQKQEKLEIPQHQKPVSTSTTFYRTVWQKTRTVPSMSAREGERKPLPPLLMFDMDNELRNTLQSQWQDQDHREPQVILVTPGKDFNECDGSTFEINPQSGEDYIKLVNALADNHIMPQDIIHCWSQASSAFPSRPEDLAVLLDRGIYSLFYLAKALVQRKPGLIARILYFYPDCPAHSHPQYAAVSGFAKTLHLENPKLYMKTVALEDIPVTHLADIVSYELEANDGIDIRWDMQHRYTRILENIHLETEAPTGTATEKTVKIREKGVYIITGGTGGLGLIFARHLVNAAKARLVLTGRSRLNPEKEEEIKQLNKAGGEVIYIRADISTPHGVEHVINETKSRFKQVHGVIHSAGVIRDAYIHTKTREDITAVMVPKIYGTLYLNDRLMQENLDFFVLFSAVAAEFGNAGQCDYAYANSFMDHFASMYRLIYKQKKIPGKVLSINWTLWQEGGMKLDERLLKIALTSGMSPLPTEKGIYAFEKGLTIPGNQLIVVHGPENPQQIKQLYTKINTFTAQALPSTGQPEIQADQGELLEKIQKDIGKVISLQLKINESSLDPEEDIKEYGYDSINLTVLANRLNETFSLEMTPAIFFELADLTIHAIALYLLQEYHGQILSFYSPGEMGASPALNLKAPAGEVPIAISPVPVRESQAEGVPQNTTAPAHQHHEELRQQIRQDLFKIVSDQLDMAVSNLEADEKLTEYGYDSVQLTTLARNINETFSLELTPAFFFELSDITINAIAHYLHREHRRQMQSLYPQQEPTVSHQEEQTEHNNEERTEYREAAEQVMPRLSSTEPGKEGSTEGFAIIGISGRMPQCEDLEDFWNHLEQGDNLITEIPPDRWDWRKYYGDPLKNENKSNSRWGGFMKQVDRFDAKFFNISPREAELMDPQQRIILETVWEAIEDAGYKISDLAGTNTGFFMGVSNSDYSILLLGSNLGIQAQAATGLSHAILTNRVSYLLDIHGPCEAINTACSSSLVAIHRAVEAIRSGSCHMAIAGGVNAILSPVSHIAFGKVGVLSDDGTCRTFDKDANGIVRGEGAGVIMIKPLKKAIADRDHIYAVIRGTGENHGGHSTSLTAPNPNAQSRLIEEVFARAHLDPTSVSYIECHGTGTRLGDPVEINGLKKAFEKLLEKWGKSSITQKYCALGSVKTNIGHLEAAAGIASVLKVVLALKYKKIPANINFHVLNPYIQLEKSPFYIVDKTREWQALKSEKNQEITRRSAVSSFGLGGSNAHIILEEYKEAPRPITGAPLQHQPQKPEPRIIVLSAKNQERLRHYTRKIIHFLEQQDRDMENLAYTLQVGREPMNERLAVICTSSRELHDKLQEFYQASAPGQTEADTRIPGLYRGRVQSAQHQLEQILEGVSGREFIGNIIKNKEYKKLVHLWLQGVEIDWKRLYTGRIPCRISLPTYPFARDRYWLTGEDPLRDFFYIPNWTPSPLLLPTTPHETSRNASQLQEHHKSSILLIYSHNSPGSQAIKKELANAHSSDQVLEIRLGSETRQHADGSWEINTGDSTALNQMADYLKPLDCIYFLGGIQPRPTDAGNLELLEQSQEYGVIALFRLVKFLSSHGFTRETLRLKVITSHVHRVLPADKINPYGGSILGLAQAIQLEYPSIETSCIDIDWDVDTPDHKNQGKDRNLSGDQLREIISMIQQEPGHKRGEIIALRQGKRYIQEITPIQISPAQQPPFRDKGIYMIIGGARGIGLELARYLAKTFRAGIALVNRSSLSEKQKKEIASIAAPGGDVFYVQADVTDPEAMKQAVEKVKSRFGEINGVIHSAVVIKDNILESMDEETFRAVLAPKVRGSVVLNQAVQDQPLDFMLFFSSAISFASNLGQGNYAAASTFADAFALYLSQEKSYPVKIINWGYWGSVGVASAKTYETHFAAKGLQSIEPQEGMEAINRIVAQHLNQVLAVKRLSPDQPGKTEVIQAQPKKQISTQNRQQPKKMSDEALASYIEGRIIFSLSKTLKIPAPEFSTDTPFTDFGVDSVLAIEIVDRVNDDLGIQLRSTDLFNYSTIRLLVRHIKNNFNPAILSGDEESNENAPVPFPEPVIVADETDEMTMKAVDESPGKTGIREENIREILERLKQGELSLKQANLQMETIG